LQELRTAADAEAAALKEQLSEAVARDKIRAARIKAELWDSLEVRMSPRPGLGPIFNLPIVLAM
jgi:hypothetical protein